MPELRSYEEIGGDAAGMALEAELRADYTLAGAQFRGIGAWMYRVCYTAQTKGIAGAIAQHQAEWRAGLERAAERTVVWPTPAVRPFPHADTRPALVLPAGSYARGLPWTPPKERDFMRADCWGITLPGLPFVAGASEHHPERFLSWFFDRYDETWQNAWLDQNGRNGYTHGLRSVADSLGDPNHPSNGGPPGAGQSLAQFVASCRRMKDYGLPYVTVMLGSKCFQPANMSTAQWIAYVDPIMDALIQEDAADEFVPGWEWDLWNQPGDVSIQVAKHVGQRAHAAGKSCWLHFSSEKTSWFKDKEPRGRFGFWDDISPEVDGLLYQTVPTWSMKDTQDRLVDTLWQFGGEGNRHKLRFFEDQAALMFDHDRPNEDDANARGYAACCTIDNVRHTAARIWGYGNGGRSPDGSPL